VLLLRRRLSEVLLTQRSAGEPAAATAQLRPGFVELAARRQAWEYAVLVTPLEAELLTIAQLYRDRDAENNFDELKNQLGLERLHHPGPQTLPADAPHRRGRTCSSAWPTPTRSRGHH
jgi:hypothetical protein